MQLNANRLDRISKVRYFLLQYPSIYLHAGEISEKKIWSTCLSLTATQSFGSRIHLHPFWASQVGKSTYDIPNGVVQKQSGRASYLASFEGKIGSTKS